jgi:hypothetical protein
MVCRLLKALEGGRLPDDGGELDVAGIVYLSPVGGHPVSFPNLFADLCRLLPEDHAETLGERYQDPQQTPAQLMLAVLEAFPAGAAAGPSVVLLDNCEDLIDEAGAVTDPALDEALRALLTGPDHGVKVVLTTRVAPRELLLIEPGRQRRLNLDEGLGSPFAENILRAMDPTPASACRTPRRSCWRWRGNGPGGSRGRWRRWRRLCPRTGTPTCRSCWPRRPGCPGTWLRLWWGRRSAAWIRWLSR